MRILLLSISLFVSAPAVLIEYTLTDEECLEAGFIRKDLKCAYCKELRKFQLEMIMTDCFACCTKDPEDEHPMYPYAIMDVCECNLARFPQVQAFVHENMAASWGDQVRIRHVRGATPEIHLIDHAGDVAQSFNVEKWDTDTIKEFFYEFLE